MRDYSGSVTTQYKFTDQEFDPESGLYNYNARLYDPALGRFISADSLVQDPFVPQTLNRYSYVGNNPLLYVDPSGHFIESLIFGALIGGITSAASDGDVGIGILTGAISGFLFGLAGVYFAASNIEAARTGGGMLTALEKAGVHAGAGGLSGGINATISGNDIGMGVLTGGLSGGFGSYVGNVLPQDNFSQFTGQTVAGGVMGGLASEWSGGSFKEGFAFGARTAAIGFAANNVLHRGWRIIVEGEKMIGWPYKWGGDSETGIDCSHHVNKAYINADSPYKYEQTSTFENNAKFKQVSIPRVGDVVLFDSHMGLFNKNPFSSRPEYFILSATRSGGVRYGPTSWFEGTPRYFRYK